MDNGNIAPEYYKTPICSNALIRPGALRSADVGTLNADAGGELGEIFFLFDLGLPRFGSVRCRLPEVEPRLARTSTIGVFRLLSCVHGVW